MPDKMTRKEAIKQVIEFMSPNRNISWVKKADVGQVKILLSKDEEAIKTLVSHTRECPSCKKVKKVVGKIIERIEEIEDTSVKWNLKWVYDLLTEEN